MRIKNLAQKFERYLQDIHTAFRDYSANKNEFNSHTASVIWRRKTRLISVEHYIGAMSDIVENEIEPVIERYCSSELPVGKGYKKASGKYPIWVCWLQGRDQMPALCAACVSQMEKILPDNAEIIFITYDNYLSYVDIPEEVIEKHLSGKISPVNYTDIIRYGLLAKHGGAWIDTAIYLTAGIMETAFSYPVYSPRFYSDDNQPLLDASRGRWVGGCWFAQSGNSLFSFVYDSLIYFWKNHERAIEYLVCDYIIWSGYKNIEEIRKILDQIPINNKNIRLLNESLNRPYNETEFRQIQEKNSIHLINRHLKYELRTKEGKPTLYSRILNEK